MTNYFAVLVSIFISIGFFTSEDSEAPGNFGMLDQTLALRSKILKAIPNRHQLMIFL